MTRVANPRNEGTLLNLALHGTAHHVEKLVRNCRRGQRLEALNAENRRQALRELSWFFDDDGGWVFQGRFAPEQGALIAKALEKAPDQQFAERRDEHPAAALGRRRDGLRLRPGAAAAVGLKARKGFSLPRTADVRHGWIFGPVSAACGQKGALAEAGCVK